MKISNSLVVFALVYALCFFILIVVILFSVTPSDAKDATTLLFQLVLWGRLILFVTTVGLGLAMFFAYFNIEQTDRNLVNVSDRIGGMAIVFVVFMVLVPYFFIEDYAGWTHYYKVTHPLEDKVLASRIWVNLVTPRQDFGLDLLARMFGMLLGAAVPLAVMALAWLIISRIIKDRRP